MSRYLTVLTLTGLLIASLTPRLALPQTRGSIAAPSATCVVVLLELETTEGLASLQGLEAQSVIVIEAQRKNGPLHELPVARILGRLPGTKRPLRVIVRLDRQRHRDILRVLSAGKRLVHVGWVPTSDWSDRHRDDSAPWVTPVSTRRD